MSKATPNIAGIIAAVWNGASLKESVETFYTFNGLQGDTSPNGNHALFQEARAAKMWSICHALLDLGYLPPDDQRRTLGIDKPELLHMRLNLLQHIPAEHHNLVAPAPQRAEYLLKHAVGSILPGNLGIILTQLVTESTLAPMILLELLQLAPLSRLLRFDAGKVLKALELNKTRPEHNQVKLHEEFLTRLASYIPPHFETQFKGVINLYSSTEVVIPFTIKNLIEKNPGYAFCNKEALSTVENTRIWALDLYTKLPSLETHLDRLDLAASIESPLTVKEMDLLYARQGMQYCNLALMIIFNHLADELKSKTMLSILKAMKTDRSASSNWSFNLSENILLEFLPAISWLYRIPSASQLPLKADTKAQIISTLVQIWTKTADENVPKLYELFLTFKEPKLLEKITKASFKAVHLETLQLTPSVEHLNPAIYADNAEATENLISALPPIDLEPYALKAILAGSKNVLPVLEKHASKEVLHKLLALSSSGLFTEN